MSRDPLDLSPPAMHSERLTQSRQHAEVPNASDAQATMEYWDEYRRKERARFAEMNLMLDADNVPVPGQGLKLDIREFPTAATVLQKQIDEMLKNVYERGGSVDYALITIEQARKYGLIGPLEYQWRRLHRSLCRGISKLRDSFGGAFARRPRGTEPTA